MIRLRDLQWQYRCRLNSLRWAIRRFPLRSKITAAELLFAEAAAALNKQQGAPDKARAGGAFLHVRLGSNMSVRFEVADNGRIVLTPRTRDFLLPTLRAPLEFDSRSRTWRAESAGDAVSAIQAGLSSAAFALSNVRVHSGQLHVGIFDA